MINLNLILIFILTFIIYNNININEINYKTIFGIIIFIYYIYPYIIMINKQENEKFTNTIRKYLK